MAEETGAPPPVRFRHPSDGVERDYYLVGQDERGRPLLRSDDGRELVLDQAPDGRSQIFPREVMRQMDAELSRGSASLQDRTTASAPVGGYLLNPLWLLVLAAGAWGTWRLYEGGVNWWWTALVATLGWLWAIGITHNLRRDPDRLPSIVGPLGLLSGLACVGLLVTSFLVT